MSVIIFLIILSVLVFVHELGHFLFAKWCGIRVDSFAIGFPPTILKKKKGETTYKINILPLGGYVSIYGENYDTLDPADKDYGRSFVMKKPWQQLLVLLGGILFNFIFAFLILTMVGWIGAPAVVDTYTPTENYSPDVSLTIAAITPDSPAHEAELAPGDSIISASTSTQKLSAESLSIENLTKLIRESSSDVELLVEHHHEQASLLVTPEEGFGADESRGIGIGMIYTQFTRDSFGEGIINGWKSMIGMTSTVAGGLKDLVAGNARIDDLTGPVGLTGAVGQASEQGIAQLLLLTAFISINLALLNLIPFPALDGGRVLFVIIETITRKRIPSQVGQWVNGVGFILLMLLMLVVTVKDVIGLF
ncbi:site-2 protease family protein [Candidatus Nomurabacteria bacterium]|nr:site-2 protease family protein [Candidatus Nomurabacteria bacterium]